MYVEQPGPPHKALPPVEIAVHLVEMSGARGTIVSSLTITSSLRCVCGAAGDVRFISLRDYSCLRCWACGAALAELRHELETVGADHLPEVR